MDARERLVPRRPEATTTLRFVTPEHGLPNDARRALQPVMGYPGMIASAHIPGSAAKGVAPVARTTSIRNASQGDYRLREECSTDTARVGDAPVEYRLAGVAGHPIERIGSGWLAVGRTPGAPMGPDELDEMRAVMVGADPRTGQRLIGPPKTAVAKAAKLPALPLLKAILAAKATVPAGSWAHKRLGRLARALDKDAAHTAPIRDLKRVAGVAGIDPADVWGKTQLAYAKHHQDERVEARVRGWDLTLDAPKSVSVLYALGDPSTAAAVENAYLAAVRQTVATVEEWISSGQRGEHGRGRTARRVATHGLLATLTLHTSARPVNGEADPHLHAHIMIGNLGQAVEDGRWGGIAAGGRELYINTPAIGELMRANLRTRLAHDLGVRWVEEQPGRWEIAGIGPDVRDLYSHRRDQALKKAGTGAGPAQRRLAARRTVTSKLKGQAATDRRGLWAERARQARINPNTLVATATGRRLHNEGQEHEDLDPVQVQAQRADRAAAHLWSAHPTTGVSRARLIAAAAATTETGMTTDQAEQVADAVIERSAPAGGTARGAHLRHATRYTAPPLSESAARTGQGPAARAARHEVAVLQARHVLAQQQADSARAAIRGLEPATRSGPAAWKRGTTRRSANEEIDRLTTTIQDATATAARLESQIRRARSVAIDTDLDSARAQTRARQALQLTQSRARMRAYRPTRPIPRPPAPQAGQRPGAGPPPSPVFRRRSSGPERGGGGPSR